MSPVEVERSEDGRLSGRWAVKREEGGTGWVEVTSLLLGEPGRMRAMPPSLRIKTVGPVLTPHEHIMVRSRVHASLADMTLYTSLLHRQ